MILASHLEAQKNQIREALMHPLSSAPSSPSAGQVYFDTTLVALGVWTGSAWRYFGTLDQITAAAADVDFGGFKAKNLADPVSSQDAATMAWVLANAAGVRDPKDSVRIATTAALPTNTRSGNVLTASSNGAFPSVDGVTLTAGDSVSPDILVKDESTGANNGIYTLTRTGSGGTTWQLTRRGDADTSTEVTSGLYVWVNEGSANLDSGWLLTTNDAITLNTTALSFTQISGLGQVVAGAGVTKTGASQIDVGAGTGIIVNANDVAIDPSVVVRKASGLIGDNSSTSIDLVHGLNSRDCIVEVYQAATPYSRVFCDVKHKDANTVTLEFTLAPTTNQYKVVVHD